MITDLLTEEALVMSYEYNSMTPRFFSKYFHEIDRENYNYAISQIVEAAVSQGELFLPKIIDENLFLDTDILSKTPSMLAYLMAKHFVIPDKAAP